MQASYLKEIQILVTEHGILIDLDLAISSLSELENYNT